MNPDDKENVGMSLHILRQRSGLSIRQLAELSGVTAGMISLVERGKNSPSLATLRKILTALGTDLGTFFGSGEGKQDGPVFLREGMQDVADQERRYTLIFPRRGDLEIQMLDEHYTPTAQKPPFEKLKCSVAGYVLSGTMVVEFKGQPVKTLRPGDAFYVPPGVEHRGYAAETEAVRLITVYSPANY